MRIYHASGPEARQSEARRFFQPWQGWGYEAPSDPGRTKTVNACMLPGFAKKTKCSNPKETSVEILAQTTLDFRSHMLNLGRCASSVFNGTVFFNGV